MNRDQIEGNWKQLKGAIQQKWGKITNDDLDIAKGDLEVLVGKVQERYGRRREEAEREVGEWLDSVNQPGTTRATGTVPSGALSDSEDEIVTTRETDLGAPMDSELSDTARNIGRDRNPSNLL